jgi:YVTN family beta-propeller protein
MSFTTVTARFALSFLLFIISLILVSSIFVDLNSYAKSDDNKNENTSSLSSLPSLPISSDIKVDKKSKALIDANTSLFSSSSSSALTSNSINETSHDKSQDGTLVVTKQVINEGGGNKNPSDFIVTVNGNNPTPSSFAGSSSGTTVQLSIGKYEVTESGPTTNYNSTLSNECSGTIKVGEIKKCTIINTYSALPPPPPITTGKIIVTKKVINEGGGNKNPSDFTVTVNGNNPTPSSFAGSSSGTTVNLKPGSYSVIETGLPGYTADYSNGCTGSIKAGTTNKCTITNMFQPPDESAQLIVIKNVIDNNNNSYGLTVKPSAFTITVHGNNPLPRSFPGKSGDGVTINLDAGRYRVTEDEGPSGYKTDYSNSCQGTISAGEAKVCIITNEPIIPPQPTPPSPVPNPPVVLVTETIKGFSAPYGIALNLDNDLIYVTNYGQFNTTGTVTAINSTTNTVVATIPVGKNPQAIAYNPANGLFYVANTLSGTLSIINGTSNSLIGSIAVGDFPGKNPTGIAVNAINNTIYVTNMGSNTVSVINGTTNVVIDNITSGTRGNLFSPTGIAYDSDNDNIYVINRGSDTVSVINGTTNTLIDEISIDAIAPSGIIYNPLNNYIYVTNMGSNTVSVINGTSNTLVETIPIGLGPNGVAYDQNNGNIYVANSINGTISAISGLTNTISSTILIGINNTPTGVLYNLSNDSVYATNTNSNTISVIKNQ